MPDDMARFLQEKLRELAGKRVFVMGSYNLLYELATEGLARGVEAVFAPARWWPAAAAPRASCCPPDWQEPVLKFFGVDRLVMGYGMSEISAMHMMCESGRYHVQPWVIPFVLRPRHQRARIPAKGVQVGRAAFYDPATTAHWGGIMSGDEIELSYEPCSCGRTTLHIGTGDRALQREAGRRPHHLRRHPAAPARGHRLPEGDRVG